MGTPEYFVRLFDYEARCSDLALRSLRDARRSVEQLSLASLAAPYERAVAIFCHIQAARRLWLYRIEPALSAFPTDGVFPVWDLKHAEAESREMDELWSRFTSTLPSRDLAAGIAYTSTEGVQYRSVLADILTHVVNHSSYHRGQIASLVAATGVKPAVTDYIALTRRTV